MRQGCFCCTYYYLWLKTLLERYDIFLNSIYYSSHSFLDYKEINGCLYKWDSTRQLDGLDHRCHREHLMQEKLITVSGVIRPFNHSEYSARTTWSRVHSPVWSGIFICRGWNWKFLPVHCEANALQNDFNTSAKKQSHCNTN